MICIEYLVTIHYPLLRDTVSPRLTIRLTIYRSPAVDTGHGGPASQQPAAAHHMDTLHAELVSRSHFDRVL